MNRPPNSSPDDAYTRSAYVRSVELERDRWLMRMKLLEKRQQFAAEILDGRHDDLLPK